MLIISVLKSNGKFLAAILLVLVNCCSFNKLSAQTNQTVTAGANTSAVNFPAGSCVYRWTNNNPSIGLPASGFGNIASFTAINNTSSTVAAQISAVPVAVQFAYITNFGDNTVSVINTLTNTVIKTITVGQQPSGVAISPDGNKVYIGNLSNISVIDAATNTVTGVISLSGAINGIKVSPDGSRIYAANESNKSIWVIDALTNAIITQVPVAGNCMDVTISPDGKTIYATGYPGTNVSVVDAATLQVTANIPVDVLAYYISISPDGKFVYVSEAGSGKIAVINTANNVTVNHFTAGNYPGAMALNKDGSVIYVSNNLGNNVYAINTATGATIATFNTAGNPSGISLTQDDRYLYVADYTANEVEVFDTQGGSSALVSVPAGKHTDASGSFITPAPACSNAAVSFTITVNPANNSTINATGNLKALLTTYGTYSESEQFLVTEQGLTAGVVITAPGGFEVSTDNRSFYPSVPAGVGGNALNEIIFIRLKANASVGTHSGNIVISSPNVIDFDLAMPAGTVTPVQLTVTADNQKRQYGAVNPPLTYTYGGFVNAEDASVITTLPIAITSATKTSAPGNYPITVSGGAATNYTFNYVSGTLTVMPVPGLAINVPNAFTPNADGVNDTWNIANLNGYTQSRVQIFNRYGGLVFNSVGYGIPWDATFRGASVPDGTYYYIITLSPGDIPIAGPVSVIR